MGEADRDGKPIIRKARIQDGRRIHELIELSASRGLLLPRTLRDIYENIREFVVCELDGKVVGCCALKISWEDLGEIRSLVVEDGYRGKGIGRMLVLESVEEARGLGLKRVFALTRDPGFFEGLGFRRIEKSSLPHKIWRDCIRCTRFFDCDEVAVEVDVGDEREGVSGRDTGL